MEAILNEAKSAVINAYNLVKHYEKEIEKYRGYLADQQKKADTLQLEYDQMEKLVKENKS